MATEIDRCARLILTASSAGSAFIASATVRVKQETRSGAAAVAALASVFIDPVTLLASTSQAKLRVRIEFPRASRRIILYVLAPAGDA